MSESPPDIVERLNRALAGRYRVQREVGRGGMATVYAADDLRHGRTVAIKILDANRIESSEAERFLREIQVVAPLSHPHILPLLDSGLADSRPFFVMPFIVGDTLAGHLEKVGALSLEETVRITREVARGLAYAHEQGLVHRDIKPENILLSSGQAVIADFGIAQAVTQASDHRLTRSGTSVGTAYYMSPEQWSGAPVDARSDQYSLACMVYQMLVGEPPFTGVTPQIVLARHLQGTVPSIRIVRNNVTEAVDAAIERALAKVPQDRFPSVLAFIEALEAGVGAAAVPVATQRAKAHVPHAFAAERRSQRLVTTLAFAGVAAGSALVAWSVFAGGPSDETMRLVVLPFETLDQPDRAHWGEGIAEEITNRLGGIASIGVVGRTSARQYAGTTMTSAQIGAELNVQYLVEGSIRWYQPGETGDSVQVTARLVRAEDAEQIWIESYDVNLSGGLQVQAEIATQVSEELNVRLVGNEAERLAASSPTSGAAFERVLLGNAAYDRSRSQLDAEEALSNYQEAVDIDSEYALGWAKLSRTHAFMNQLRYDMSEDRLVLAKQTADRALGLDPDLPEGHMALGLYYYWGRSDFVRALEEFEKARALRPNDAEAFLLIGHIARRQGRWPEAIDSYRKSAELDPRFPRAWFNLGETLLITRDYAGARENLEKALEVAPDFFDAYTQLARVAINEDGDVVEAREVLRQAEERIPRSAWRGVMLDFARVLYNPDLDAFLAGLRPGAYGLDSASYYAAKASMVSQTRGPAAAAPQFDSARVLFARMVVDQPDQPAIHAQLGTVFAGLGRAEEAVRSAKRAMELLPLEVDALEGPEYLVLLATVYVMLGDIDNGVACFDRALTIPSWVSTNSLALDPVLRPMRDTPQFRALVAKWAPTGGATLATTAQSTSCR